MPIPLKEVEVAFSTHLEDVGVDYNYNAQNIADSMQNICISLSLYVYLCLYLYLYPYIYIYIFFRYAQRYSMCHIAYTRQCHISSEVAVGTPTSLQVEVIFPTLEEVDAAFPSLLTKWAWPLLHSIEYIL